MNRNTEPNGAGSAPGSVRVRTVRRHTARRELPPLDLRSPSGKRRLPY